MGAAVEVDTSEASLALLPLPGKANVAMFVGRLVEEAGAGAAAGLVTAAALALEVW